MDTWDLQVIPFFARTRKAGWWYTRRSWPRDRGNDERSQATERRVRQTEFLKGMLELVRCEFLPCKEGYLTLLGSLQLSFFDPTRLRCRADGLQGDLR